ncbi:MAG TPA: hypothetical protein VE153_18160 [Myxococcus sp.]|nr:hypothetical protein [Myxococcus sp.]
MSRKLLLCLLLAVVTGCRTLGNRPDPGPCPEPGPVPEAPRTQTLPPGGALPQGANHIVVGMCPATGAYLGAGIDTKTRSFTYVVRGDRSTLDTFLTNAYRARVPVVLYTSPVKVAGTRPGTVVGAVAPAPGSGEEVFDPCTDVPPVGGTRAGPGIAPQSTGGPAPSPTGTGDTQMIGDEPPPDPDDPGGANPPPPPEFSELSWRTATAVDNTADSASASTAPTTTEVPR